MSNTGKELLKTLGLFTLGVAFGYVPMFLCFSEDYDTFSWSGFGGSLIAVIFFLATRYVSLSPGLIERRNLWQLIGLIVLVVLSDVTWQVAIYELPCYLNLFPDESSTLPRFLFIRPNNGRICIPRGSSRRTASYAMSPMACHIIVGYSFQCIPHIAYNIFGNNGFWYRLWMALLANEEFTSQYFRSSYK